MKPLLHNSLLLALLPLLFAPVMPALASDNAGVTAIIQRGEQWEAAIRSGDAAAVAALYAEDGRLLPPGSDFVTGHEAITFYFQAFLAAGVREIRTELVAKSEPRDRPALSDQQDRAIRLVEFRRRRTGR